VRARDIKDKRIYLEGLVYVAEVHMLDGRVISCGRHMTLKAAQKELTRYPSDVFEGYDDPTKVYKVMQAPRSHFQSRPRKKKIPYTRLYDRRIK